MSSDGIWNDLELQRKQMKTRTLNGAFRRYLKRFGTAERFRKNDGKWCIVMVFETDWNWNKNKSRSLFQRAFWHYLKRYFGTAEKLSKTMTVKRALGQFLERFGTAAKNLKTRTVNGALCCYFIRYFDLQRKNWNQWS